MTPQEFTQGLKEAIVKRNERLYVQLFEAGLSNDVAEPFWQRALTLYQSLDEVSRTTMLEIVHQVIVDTISSTLAALDGTATLHSPDERFSLISIPDQQELIGNLQDYFLQAMSKKT